MDRKIILLVCVYGGMSGLIGEKYLSLRLIRQGFTIAVNYRMFFVAIRLRVSAAV